MERPVLSTRAWLLLLGALVAIVWVVPTGRSLWLDETLTWWVVDGDLAGTLDRAFRYQGSPLAFLLAWPSARVGGASEVALRIPSVLVAIAAAAMLWRLAERLIARGAGPVAVLGWIGTWATVEASDARPYALALAFAVGSTLALVRTLDRPTAWRAALYGLTVAGMLWTHLLFAVMLPAHAAYVLARHRRGEPRMRFTLAAIAVGVGIVALAPQAGQIASLWSRREVLTTGGASVFVAPLLFANLVVIPAGLVTFAVARGKARFARVSAAPSTGALLVAWCIAPPALLWLISVLSAPYFINARYLVSATPAVALLVAWGVMAIVPDGARRVFVVALAVLTAVGFSVWGHRTDDWRDAIAAAATASDADTLVLARVRLVEAKQVDWFDDPERRSYLQAPFSFYPLGADPVPLPLFPHDPGADEYLDALLRGPVAATDRFLLIEQGDTYQAWLDERLGPLGWTRVQIGTVEEPEVTEYTRTV